jgi:FkbM family methyltransferase
LTPAPVVLSRRVVQNDSIVEGDGPVEIITPPRLWAYAVAFPVHAEPWLRGRKRLIIRIEASVKAGRVGIGCVTPDLTSFASPEINRAADDAETTFDIPVEYRKDCQCAWLVVRNTCKSGSSHVVLHSIRTVEVEGNLSDPAKMYTNVPGWKPIRFSHYYEEFVWYYPDCELETKRWWVQNVKPDWVIFDCGANVGYYSILFSQLAPHGRVYAFEPTSTADMLAANLRENDARNVEVCRLALGATPGRRVEHIYRLWGREPERQEFEFTTIDDFVSEREISRLDALKIDVDSFDFEVLMGAERTLARFDPYVVVELNDALSKRQHSNAEAFDWLSKRGYSEARVLEYENYVLKRSLPAHRYEGRRFQLIF